MVMSSGILVLGFHSVVRGFAYVIQYRNLFLNRLVVALCAVESGQPS